MATKSLLFVGAGTPGVNIYDGIATVGSENSIRWSFASESEHDCWMIAIAFLFVRVLCDCLSRPDCHGQIRDVSRALQAPARRALPLDPLWLA